MIRRPPRSTLFPLHDALPIFWFQNPLPGAGRARRSTVPASFEDCLEGLETTGREVELGGADLDRKSTRLNSSHANISYAVFCLKKKCSDKEVDGTTTSLQSLL